MWQKLWMNDIFCMVFTDTLSHSNFATNCASVYETWSVCVWFFVFLLPMSSISCQDTDNVILLKTMNNERINEKKRTTTQTITNFMKLQFFSVDVVVVIANNSNCQRCYSSFARFQNDIVNGTDMSGRKRKRVRENKNDMREQLNPTKGEQKWNEAQDRQRKRERERKSTWEINESDLEKLWKNSCSTDIIEYARKTF